MDFIITWVDGNDPTWREKYKRYKKDENGDDSEARFRDWDNLQYWFRGVEKFAPWIDKVHLVTYGHLPDWLNTGHSKLNIVNHQDYIPEKYLPTFNSHTIELNFHRIKELSEEYVYFNDDTFLINHVKKEFFFKDGKPCDMPISRAIIGGRFNHILLSNMAVLKKHFDRKYKIILQKPSNWFNFKYGLKNNIRNLLFLGASKNLHTGFVNFHLPQPHLKKTLNYLWENEYSVLDETCRHTFRSFLNVSPYLQRYWELASNNFIPVNMDKHGENFEFRADDPSEAAKFIEKQEKPMVCLNDHENLLAFNKTKEKVNAALQKILPEKSNFEK
jgi:hypothetical protein